MFDKTVRHVRKDERKYYEELLKYSRDHLMLYPYHLSDIMVKGLRVTPFSYYIGIMEVSNSCRIAGWDGESCVFGKERLGITKLFSHNVLCKLPLVRLNIYFSVIIFSLYCELKISHFSLCCKKIYSNKL